MENCEKDYFGGLKIEPSPPPFIPKRCIKMHPTIYYFDKIKEQKFYEEY
jgi:hypothetical protein